MPVAGQKIHWDLSQEIIGAAMAVLNELGPGLDEKLYENALIIELTNRGRRIDQQKQFSVYYQNRFIGKLIPDLIVDDLVIVDTKVVECFCDEHLAQMLGYLKIANLELALLVNFKFSSLRWKRIVQTVIPKEHNEPQPLEAASPSENPCSSA
jgi:GxxExxY protein